MSFQNADYQAMSLGNDIFGQRLGPLGANLDGPRGNGASGNIVRHAMHSGRRAVTFRATGTPAGTVVECEVHPRDAAAPRTLGPYTFSTAGEARKFGDDLMRALDYLGCEDLDLVEHER